MRGRVQRPHIEEASIDGAQKRSIDERIRASKGHQRLAYHYRIITSGVRNGNCRVRRHRSEFLPFSASLPRLRIQKQ